MKLFDYRYNFYFTGVNKIKIFFNIIKVLFFMLIGKRFVKRDFFGKEIILDFKTHGLSKFVYIYGIREILDTQIIQEQIKGDMHVLDAGANIGYYAVLEASLLSDQGKVYAFEPDARNVEVLRKNVELNKYSEKIKIYPCAVSDKDEIKKFQLYKESNINSFVKNSKKVKSERETVDMKCVKLDNFSEIDKVDFIRMDIEGYECYLLDGAMEFLKRKEKIKLLMELHPEVYNDNELNFITRLERLKELGFKVRYLISAGIPRPEAIIAKGYTPIRTAQELKWNRGLYENVKMDDLIEFLRSKKKIVRTILLEK